MSQRKLLLADDSITIQKVVNLTFADEGIEVITVGDGDSAMEKMTEVAPDLVMADVNMPGLNGYQVCEKIKQSETLKRTPVILLVGSFEPFDEAEARRVGADDFLTKPFQSIRQLVNKVTDLLQSTTRNGESAASMNQERATPTVSEFETTQEYNPPEFSPAEEQSAPQYGDAGMDDEMIQTNSVGSYALDESSKFESREVSEADEVGKTQPLSFEDLQQFPFTNQQESAVKETAAFKTSDEEVPEQRTFPGHEAGGTERMAWEQSASGLGSGDDDDNLLEIPFDDEEEDWEEEAAAAAASSETVAESQPQAFAPEETPAAEESATPLQSETFEPVSATPPPQQIAGSEAPEQSESPAGAAAAAAATTAQTQNSEAPSISTQLSPEMIEAIALKVVEKLSDRAVKDVAWEVVPQMADLIIKKMAEEKLKE